MKDNDLSDQAPISVLVVEDDEEDYLLTRKLLTDGGRAPFSVKWVRSHDAALEELRTPYSVCLVDYRLGAESGLSLIERAIADGFDGPMILLTGRGDRTVDVEAMKAGAADYLVKDQITSQLMERVIRHSIERRAAELGRKATEVALRESEDKLRQSQKMEAIGSLAGGIAHDFNNLLTVILSYSELLAAELNPGDPMRNDLEAIHESGMRAADLTRQLLAFSRQQVLRPRVLDLNDVVRGMEKMLRRLIGEDVELTAHTNATLSKIMADPGQMEQVIMNLAVNARDAMPNGGRLAIEMENVHLEESDIDEQTGVKTSGPHVMLAITDTGVGMDRATQARMFEPFFTTKEIGTGTGLGLSTVFGIVKQSGGAIRAQSELGRGTSFKTYFPVTHPSAASVRPVAPVEPRTLQGSETILLVEDEERVRILTRTILKKYGYEVLEAGSGGDALIVSEQWESKIDLLLTDVVMPRMSGQQLAGRLLVSRPAMKVLYTSGYTGGLTLEDLHASGAPFLQKPITPEALARHVREALNATDGAAAIAHHSNTKSSLVEITIQEPAKLPLRRVLVVDDDEAVLRLNARILTRAGFEVSTAASGDAAIRAIQASSFDVIMSDIDMPGMSGVELLERIRRFELDLPLVLITGAPTTDSAIRALAHGALRYLLKPVDPAELVNVAKEAVSLHQIAKAKRQALVLAGGLDRLLGDHAGLTSSFGRAIGTLFMAYQPIVSWSRRRVFGYEALLRSKEASLPHPGAVFDAAERLNRVHELGRAIRASAVEPLSRLGDDIPVFINLHPNDLLDDQLFMADAPMAQVAKRVVLEITERASLHGIAEVSNRMAKLRDLGFRVALDDLGAGYAGLTSFALLKPDIVKLDMALVRDLHRHPTQQTLVRTMVSMCKELGLVFIGEGVETPEERDELARCGCDLMQGYLFGKPGEPFAPPRF